MMTSEVHTFQGSVQKYDAMHSLKRQCTSKRDKMCYIQGILHSKKSPWSFTVENGLAIEGNNGSQMGQEKLLQSTVYFNVQVKQEQSVMMT